MSTIRLEAQTRTDIGKGASRRLRRLENKVPAVLYGGDHAPKSLHLAHNLVIKALETESIYSSVFDLIVDGKAKAERVILKALQRHPFRPIILHMDLQRVAATDVLVKMVPIHFINEENAPGIADGGVVNHTMTQVEVRCEARHLPEFIALDIGKMALNDTLHLSDLVMPKGVHLAIDPLSGDHDHPVVSIHLSKAELSEEVSDVVEGEEGTETDGVDADASEATDSSKPVSE
jgi:large subunit ribosomal protein L25